MTKIQVRCDICHDSLFLDKFRFFFCGHGLCEVCLDKTRRQKSCAVCRQPKGSHEPRQIFITFVEVEGHAKSVVDGLNRISIESPAISIERAGKKIREVAKHVDRDVVRDLVEAAQNLEERILPLYTKLEHERADNIALLAQMIALEKRLKESQVSAQDIARKDRMLREMEQDLQSVFNVAEEARDQFTQEREENIRLKGLIERQQRSIEKKDNEFKQCQSVIGNQEKQIGLLTRKLRALTKMGPRPKPQQQEGDESLQIEGSNEHVKPKVIRKRKRMENAGD